MTLILLGLFVLVTVSELKKQFCKATTGGEVRGDKESLLSSCKNINGVLVDKTEFESQ